MWKRLAPAIGLVFLAPIVAEYLLGNLPITMVVALVGQVPLYGGGALLIREVARRHGLGWPGIALLGLAFAVLEEGLVTQSLFNPDYAGLRLLDYGWIPALGMGAWWTVFVLALHTAWSICVPIALVETLAGARERTPWLGRPGLAVISAVFLLGAVGTTMMNPTPYLPSPPQIIVTVVLAGALVGAALLVPRSAILAEGNLATEGSAPSPWVTFGFALAAGALFWIGTWFLDVAPVLLMVLNYLALYVGVVTVLLYWSRRRGWGPPQVFGLAAGGVLTYAWHSFVQPPVVPAPAGVDLAGDVFFTLAAVALLAITVVRLRRTGSAAAPSRTTRA